MIYIFIILTVLFLLGFVAFAIYTVHVRKNARKQYQKQFMEDPVRVPVAHAGSDDGVSPVRPEETVVGLNMIEFKDSQGETMKPEDYDLYIVEGECMQYVNIHDKNLVFATKGFDYKSYDGKMPVVLVMKKTNVPQDSVRFKLRRSWRFCEYSPDRAVLEEVVRDIMKAPDFQEIRNRKTYDSDEEMLIDFRKRLNDFEEKYINRTSSDVNYKEIVISTTHHTNEDKTRFSIHPVSNIVGKVEGAFKLPDECILKNEVD